MKKYYLTTAIAYTSSVPHIGNVYESVLSDAIARYKRYTGFDVFFQTGTDEHGQKIEDKAKALGTTPQEHVDMIAGKIKEIYDMMDISYDHFIRTTDQAHERKVQEIFKKLYDQGDIYKGHYEGNYCKACESFFTTTQLNDGKCPDCGGAVTLEQEEAYFFNIKKYQSRLMDHINTHPEFIQPESRKNEMVNNFLKEELPDLCVSRSTFTWGVPVTFDSKHVVYVWIDALSNYITELGFDINGNHTAKYKKYWPADVHIIGKDILRFHTIYWPIMLMALGEPLPTQIFGHPWLLINNNKMSKSKGNSLYAQDLVDYFGVDAVRYYVLHEIPFAQDGNLTYELLIDRTNSDLANTLGNLVNRTIVMQRKYKPEGVSFRGIENDFDRELVDKCYETRSKVDKYMDEFRVGDALEEIMSLARRANKYIDENEPWKLAKEDPENRLENVLYMLLETIRIIGSLLQSFIPKTGEAILSQLNTTKKDFASILSFGKEDKYLCNEPSILFSRIDAEKMMARILADEETKKPATPVVVEEPKKEKTYAPQKEEIQYQDFAKIDLVCGKIIDSKKHPNADRLLVSQVDLGNETRQIVSGIAAYYNPADIIGKKVVVVRNLKEVNLRGQLSQGMLLCASDKENDKLELLEVKDLEPGDIIS